MQIEELNFNIRLLLTRERGGWGHSTKKILQLYLRRRSLKRNGGLKHSEMIAQNERASDRSHEITIDLEQF